MEEKEPTLKDVVRMLTEQGQAMTELRSVVAENVRATTENSELIRSLSEHVDERFDRVDERFEHANQETTDQFRQVHREIADLRENTMPLEEQSELRLRVRRIEDHLGLPHEVKPA
jgi:regulator of replication initiation timing